MLGVLFVVGITTFVLKMNTIWSSLNNTKATEIYGLYFHSQILNIFSTLVFSGI